MGQYIQALSTESIIALIVSFTLALLSGLYSYYLYRKGKIRRQIKIDSGKTTEILKKHTSIFSDEIDISWKGKQIDNIYQLEMYLKNSGTKDLTEADFLKPIRISFDDKIQILKAKVYSSSENSKISWIYENSNIDINLEVIERQKIVKVVIAYTNDKISPSRVDIAIKDGNVERKSLKDYRPNKIIGDSSYYNFPSSFLRREYLTLTIFAFFSILGLFVVFQINPDVDVFLKLLVALAVVIVIPVYLTEASCQFVFKKYAIKKWIEYRSRKELEEVQKLILDYMNEA